MERYTFANYPYIRKTKIQIFYDDEVNPSITLGFGDIKTSELTEQLLTMILLDLKKRRETQEYSLILQMLPSVEHALYYLDIGNGIGKQIGNGIIKENVVLIEMIDT